MSTEPLTLVDPVGTQEIADRLHVKRGSVYSWQNRRPRENPMPEPDCYRTGTPLWQWDRIRQWAQATGRLPATGDWSDAGSEMTSI